MYRISTSGIILLLWYLCNANTTFAYTHQDTLRGSNGSGRIWWDVKEYYLYVNFDTLNKSISGMNIITFTTSDMAYDSMQIDLQEPMVLDKVTLGDENIEFSREGDVYWLKGDFKQLDVMNSHKLTLLYHGEPRIAQNPPWDGGFIWTKDSTGSPWISVACQGLGASSWWPCKDYQGDEPDSGMTISLHTPYGLATISNGTLKSWNVDKDSTSVLWVWNVKNPINTYNVSFYIGDYIGWTDTLQGEKGTLDINYFVLKHHEQRAREHFEVTKQMLHCFEYWMGPYPFYEDGYKLVEAPFLGMEHQSAVAYGNQYKMGYLGQDRSGSGIGYKFDFIIVHESGHEWYGNNITAMDIADNWLHEGFTTYTETMFAECAFGKEAAYKYTRGEWKNILNNRPVIGDYGVNDPGPGDKYDKGSAIVHMIRTMMNDDDKFRKMLRDMNKKYYHSIVSSEQIEYFVSEYTEMNLKPFFNQYLRTADIPELEYIVDKKNNLLKLRFTNTVKGFSLPITVNGNKIEKEVTVSNNWQSILWKKGGYNVQFSQDFLIKPKL